MLRENSQSVFQHSRFIFKSEKENLVTARAGIIKGSQAFSKAKKTELAGIEKNIHNMSPKNVMKRGYSITLLNGKSITSFGSVKPGDTIQTVLHEGNVLSTVNSATKPSEL